MLRKKRKKKEEKGTETQIWKTERTRNPIKSLNSFHPGYQEEKRQEKEIQIYKVIPGRLLPRFGIFVSVLILGKTHTCTGTSHSTPPRGPMKPPDG